MTPEHAHKREYLKTAALALAFVGLLALLGALRDLRHDFDQQQDDTRCILRELADHRQKNRAADAIQMEALGEDPDRLPTPPTLPDTPEWRNACKGILDHGG